MANLGFSTAASYIRPNQQTGTIGNPQQTYNPQTGTYTTNVGSPSSWQTYAPSSGGGGQGQYGPPAGYEYAQNGALVPAGTAQSDTGGYGGGGNYGYQAPATGASGGQGGYGYQQGGQQGGQQNWQQSNQPGQGYNYTQVDRSQMPQYPSYFKSPDQQPGMSYINGKWTQVNSGADVTWDSGTNTYYWHGQPLTDSEYQRLAQGGPAALTQGYSQANFGLNNTTGNLQALGFGQAPQQIDVGQFMNNVWGGGPTTVPFTAAPQAGQVGAPPQIVAPTVTAAQAGFKDFDALQNAMYHQQFDPTQTELTRQQGLADDRMAAQLAQAGISESGTGVAQRAFQSGEYDRQMVQASKEAATNAVVQRYGMQYQQSLDNAQLEQQARLANANMNLQAQTANAQNILTANITNAQLATQASIAGANIHSQEAIAGAQIASQQKIAMGQQYLDAVGLNFQQAHQAKQDYMQLMGLQEQDLQRMDTSQLNWTSLMFNTYLQQWSQINTAGGASYGKTDASSSSQQGGLKIGG